MPVVRVDDIDDHRLHEHRDLTDAAARRLVEAEHGCFVAEGLLTLESVVATGHRVRSVLVSEAKAHRVLEVLGDTASTTDVYVGDQSLLAAVAGFPIHRGVVASVDRPALADPEDLVRDALADGRGMVLVLEGVNDHENIGSLFRAAAAFGVDAVLVDERSADPLYRRSVRVSLGHVLRVPWTRVPGAVDAIGLLARAGVTTLALTPTGSVSVHDLAVGGPVAWLVGAEGPGLSQSAIDAADQRVRIPIADGVDSLNVATAAAIALALSNPSLRGH